MLNRLSKDMNTLDNGLYTTFSGVLIMFFRSVFDLGLCVYLTSLYVLIPIAIFIYLLRKFMLYFISSYREVVRLESISNSPVCSFYKETC